MAAVGELVLTEELKPKQRQALSDLLKSFAPLVEPRSTR